LLNATERKPVTETSLDQARFYPILIPVLLAVGLLLRLFQAAYRFLNADEALHYLLSVQPSIAAAYRASLTTVHPPLLIIFMHYWRMLGTSELFLRLPSVIAGTTFCWIMYRWARLVSGQATALILFVLLLFSPALVLLSAEIRQYALLLVFSASSLFWLEIAIQKRSATRIALSAVFLYLALLTHYSSFLVALALGVYALLRFTFARPTVSVAVTWGLGQLGALGLIAVLFVSHISKFEARGAAEEIATSYLRRSIFQPGEDNVVGFIARSNLRLFHYLFSQGAVGAVALLLFIVGMVFLFRTSEHVEETSQPRPWRLGVLLACPVVVNCTLAILRVYPYGGTRHDSYLAIFALPPIAIAIAQLWPQRILRALVLVLVILTVCNLFPSPIGQYIRLNDQKRSQMRAAVDAIAKLPPGSTVFTDDQGALLLSYYFCDSEVAEIYRAEPFLRSDCRNLSVVALDARKWIFKADTFPQELADAKQRYAWNEKTNLSFFQVGWLIENEPELRDELRQYGCNADTRYGRNIILCRLNLSSAK
jgi:dolichyl-phosphate-mannose-protein mannosyltransferase